MYCKLKYVVIYLKLLTNFVILRSFGNLINFLNNIEYFVYSKCGNEHENIFKKEVSIKISKIILISNIEEYQRVYNHALKKYKSRISTEKNR